MVVSPLSGTGPGQVTITASGAGLSNGAYLADLAFQSMNTLPQYVNLPILFTIGESSDLSIQGVVNGASFQADAAPGMVLSVFGTNLAPSTQVDSVLPLPLALAGVSATIDGVAAPLYYVSPQQLNIQVPYETPAGPALLAVQNNGEVTTYGFDVCSLGRESSPMRRGASFPIRAAAGVRHSSCSSPEKAMSRPR